MKWTDDQQIELFDKHRWPRKPYCTDDLAEGLRIRTLKHARRRRYIQANPLYLRVWSIYDIDRPGAVLAWEDANLLPPSWAAINRENRHAHLAWGLAVPVLIDGAGARDAPLRYLCAIESLMREKLRADPSYSGLITKNPEHPEWETIYGPRRAWDLQELAEYLPGLEQHRPKRKAAEVGLGRNVTLFDHLRTWAYRNVRQYKGGGLSAWNAWLSLCNTKALLRNGDFDSPLDGREVWHVAKSVAKWTYKHFDVEASDVRFSQLQAHRGSKGGRKGMLSRWGDNEDKQASARLMAASGLSQRAIAEELEVDKMTVNRWLKSPV